MEMIPWGMYLDVVPLASVGRCRVNNNCVYPGRLFTFFDYWNGVQWQNYVCYPHMLAHSVPFSMEYQDADALCGVPRHRRAWSGKRKHRNDKDTYILKHDTYDWSGKPSKSVVLSASGTGKVRSVRGHAKIRTNETVIPVPVPEPELNLIHWRDPIYNQFSEALRDASHAYTLCGEKKAKTCISLGEHMPTCEVCLRMVLMDRVHRWQRDHQPAETLSQKLKAIAERVMPPIVELRPGITTAQKPKEQPKAFEELVEDGTLELNPDMFFARRNWGERRSGGAFYDPNSGVQYRAHRGDWRHKRGGVNQR